MQEEAEVIPAARGRWGTVEWAIDARGRKPGCEFFERLGESDQAKVLALFRLLADTGQIRNREKFKKVVDGLFEFKSFQLRFFGDFRPGYRFIVASGVRKKQHRADPADIRVALRILEENNSHD